jgi:hypothetical protein
MTIRGKPNVEAFLDGSAAKEKPVKTPKNTQSELTKTTARMTKTIRLASDLDGLLKEQAYIRSRDSGQRITESDIIDEALRKHFNI